MYKKSKGETIAEFGSEVFKTHRFCLDGTNICFWDRSKHKASFANVLAICLALSAHGAAYVAYFDASTRFRLRESGGLGEAELYAHLLRMRPDRFKEVPAGAQADAYILSDASRKEEDERPCLIISNDKYRDYEAKYGAFGIAEHSIHGKVENGTVTFDRMPLVVTKRN